MLTEDLSVFVSADGASTQHTREPRVHSRDHVRVLQRPGSLHRRSGTFPQPEVHFSFLKSPTQFELCFHASLFFCPTSGRPGAGCLLDVQTGGRADPDGDRDRQRRRSHARHPRGKCRSFLLLRPFTPSSLSNMLRRVLCSRLKATSSAAALSTSPSPAETSRTSPSSC